MGITLPMSDALHMMITGTIRKATKGQVALQRSEPLGASVDGLIHESQTIADTWSETQRVLSARLSA